MALSIVAALSFVALIECTRIVQALPPDIQKPLIQCPYDLVIKSKENSATVCWPFPKASDNSGQAPTVTCSQRSGLTLKTPSKTSISCKASDAAGNTAHCSFRIVVEDYAPPVFTFCPADKEITSNEGQYRLNWAQPKVSDNSGIPPSITSNFRRGSLVHVPGAYAIQYTAVDDTGNRAFCSFTIKLKVPGCDLKYQPPTNGAVACFEWHGSKTCKVSCNDKYDFEFKPAFLYICTSGVWQTYLDLGGQGLQWPNCAAKSDGYKIMHEPQFYYKGDANDPNVVARIQSNCISLLSSPVVPPFFCKLNPQCKVSNVKVYAGKRT